VNIIEQNEGRLAVLVSLAKELLCKICYWRKDRRKEQTKKKT